MLIFLLLNVCFSLSNILKVFCFTLYSWGIKCNTNGANYYQAMSMEMFQLFKKVPNYLFFYFHLSVM